MRTRGDGAVYQRPNGTWAGQVSLGRDEDGKRRRKTVYGPTKKNVQTQVRSLLRQLDEHGDLPTSDQSLAQWLTYWLDNIAVRRVKPNTFRSYKTAVERHIVPAIGRHRLSRLSVDHLDRLHAYVVDERKLSTTTAHNAHHILSVALNDAVRRNKVPRNIAGLEKAPAKAENQRRSLTYDEAMAVIRAASDDERMGSRYLAAFLLGARQGECLGLRWQHLDLELGRVDLAWSLQRVPWRHGCDPKCRWKQAAKCPDRRLSVPPGMPHRVLTENLVLMRPKTTGSIRTLAMYEPLRVALLLRKAQVDAERPNYTEDHDLVWCHPDGSPIDPRDDWAAWTALLAKAGVEHVSGHETRHTLATFMLTEGVDPTVVKDMLGHSQIVVTQGYQHVSLALQQDALGRVGHRLELGDA